MRANTRASSEFRAIAGCADDNARAPLEANCAHWNDDCFQRTELMGPFGGPSLSRITIGSLQDLGFQVDYGQADFLNPSRLDSNCCEIANLSSERSFTPGLSASGQAEALAFGLEVLTENQIRINQNLVPGNEDLIDVGGSVVSVLIMEGGVIYDVIVRAEDAPEDSGLNTIASLLP